MKNHLKEVTIGIVPVIALITILQFTVLHVDLETYISFLLSNIFVIFGISMFLFGVNIAFVPVGEDIGSALVEKGKLWVTLLFGLFIGFAVTLPEPAVQTLVLQITRINPSLSNYVILLVTALGVGIFVLISFLRFYLRIKFKYLITVGYALVFILLFLAPPAFQSMAFDIGAVTTGSLTVPFMMALGIGMAGVMSQDGETQSSFGTLALASIGPILAILILGVVTSWF
jgi:hypothetical protein